MKREVTTQETLAELAAAKLKLETMQQLLVLKEQLLSSKDDQINFQIFTIKTCYKKSTDLFLRIYSFVR